MDRRRLLCLSIVAAFASERVAAQAPSSARTTHPDRRWFERAQAMRQRALAWGDQPYGAVLVTAKGLVADGPSRVVKNADPDAHAEREAIREAERLVGSRDLAGSVLYSTSRPCRLCERAAAQAGVARMYVGPQLEDAGRPRE